MSSILWILLIAYLIVGACFGVKAANREDEKQAVETHEQSGISSWKYAWYLISRNLGWLLILVGRFIMSLVYIGQIATPEDMKPQKAMPR